MSQSTKQRKISCIVFGIYIFLLVWLVLFKFATSFSDLPSMRGINFIPFHYDRETSTHLKEVLYNIIVFIPLGVYVQIFKENWKIPKKCMIAFWISFLFESLQFIFAIGASDITDIIGNTLGGIAGIFFCVVMKKITSKKYISIINALGFSIEIMALGLLILLLMAN